METGNPLPNVQSVVLEDGVFFDRESHIKYLRKCLKALPHHYIGLDTTRLSAVYFCALGLDILDSGLEGSERDDVIEFIYSNQLDATQSLYLPGYCGFIGSSYCGQPTRCYHSSDGSTNLSGGSILEMNNASNNAFSDSARNYIQGNLAMSYTALSTLVCLGDDLSRVDKGGLVQGVKSLQQDNGCFKATFNGGECDMRFLYCACAVSALLDDWSGVNKDLAAQYVLSCVTYEGGISLVPGAEAHGGATYCGVASLCLLGALEGVGEEVLDSLRHWCLHRQMGGYTGRTNKDCDSCYSFWIGATLKMLGSFGDSDFQSTQLFLLNGCQQHTIFKGGFSKVPRSPPDILHSLYSLCWLSLLNTEMKEREVMNEVKGRGESEERNEVKEVNEVSKEIENETGEKGVEQKGDDTDNGTNHSILATSIPRNNQFRCLKSIDARFTLCKTKSPGSILR